MMNKEELQRAKAVSRTSVSRAYGRPHKIPPWEAEREVLKHYVSARAETLRSGVKHVVDHKYPLVNRRVSGLHCGRNLSVVSALRNGQKGDRLPWCGRLEGWDTLTTRLELPAGAWCTLRGSKYRVYEERDYCGFGPTPRTRSDWARHPVVRAVLVGRLSVPQALRLVRVGRFRDDFWLAMAAACESGDFFLQLMHDRACTLPEGYLREFWGACQVSVKVEEGEWSEELEFFGFEDRPSELPQLELGESPDVGLRAVVGDFAYHLRELYPKAGRLMPDYGDCGFMVEYWGGWQRPSSVDIAP